MSELSAAVTKAGKVMLATKAVLLTAPSKLEGDVGHISEERFCARLRAT